MALTREEILSLIQQEEEKIRVAEATKESYQLVQQEGMVQMDSIDQQQYASMDEMKEEALANKPAEKPLGKTFYIIVIVAGLLLVALIVIIILGIVSNWDFKF